ncbi:MAG: hypothetical protein H0T60_03115, partial [Acidobacteria bacterium]|nr:hypothetical protein [Acidobacteriota bacterium]
MILFIESRTAERGIAGPLRIAVLDALQDRGLVPLIRASRLHCFEQALTSPERVGELERLVADWSDKEGDAPYVRGDVFCFDEFAHFIIFGDVGEGKSGIRAGIVYDAETDEPARKLESFCRNVREAVESAASSSDDAGLRDEAVPERFEWRAREGGVGDELAQFSSLAGDGTPAAPSQDPPRGAEAVERSRVVELLEDLATRNFLQRLSDARADGRVTETSTSGGGHEPAHEALVARLAGAGLVRREVQVSCRKDGRSLFRLPSPEALQMVTASNAVCSECGAAVADERAEELVSPTALAASMLKDGAWLSSSLRTVLV